MSMSLKQIDDYMAALRENASQLIVEAKTLHGIKAYARAHALAHFAREELAKITMLGAAATRVLALQPVDWKDLNKRLRDHKSKLRQETVQLGLMLQATGPNEMADQILAGAAADVADARNDSKNNSLYVGVFDGAISLPANTLNETHANRTIQLAELALEIVDKMHEKLGPYSARKVGSLKMPNYDEMVGDPRIVKAASALLLAVATGNGGQSR